MASVVSNARYTAESTDAVRPVGPVDRYGPADRYSPVDGQELADYAVVMRRHWWVVIAGVLLGIAVGGAVTVLQPPVYESTTSVQMLATGFDEAAVAGSRSKGTINPDTEARLVTSVVVARRARDLLRSPVDPAELRERVSVEVPPSTSILDITFAAASPLEAQAGSQAFAQAYLANRLDSARAELTDQVTALRSQIGQLQSQLQQLTEQISRLSPTSGRRAYLETQRSNLSTELASLTNRLNQLQTTPVTGGRIISDAQLPREPSQPVVALNLAGAATAGLLLALLISYLRERHDSRLRRGIDTERRAGVRLLVELPSHPRLSIDDVAPGSGVRARLFDRLRNEVEAALPDGHRLIVVTGASPGAAATLVSANLATAFARAGNEVTLVCGHLSAGTAAGGLLSRLLRVAPVPGLGDVLRGCLSLSEVAQPVPRHPGLLVVAAATGITYGQPPDALRGLFADLRRSGRYVIVDAPSAAVSADAQRLGSLADAAIIAVERRRTRHREVVDAAEQLWRVGTPLLGAVVLGRLASPVALPTAAPADRKPDHRPRPRVVAEARVSTEDHHAAAMAPSSTVEAWGTADTPTLVFQRAESIDSADDPDDRTIEIEGHGIDARTVDSHRDTPAAGSADDPPGGVADDNGRGGRVAARDSGRRNRGR